MSGLRQDQLVVFVCLFVGYSMYVLCRKGFSFIIPAVSEQENLTKAQLGLIISCQNLAYAVSKFCLGVYSDRVSARVLFVCGLCAAALSVFGFAYVHSVPAYAALWFANGLSQGCGWPSCAKLLRKWFRPDQFGTFWSLLSASNNVAGGSVPLILPWFFVNFGDWRLFMIVTSVFSCSSAAMFWAFVRDEPEVRLTNEKEKEKRKEGQVSMFSLLQSPTLWYLSIYYFLSSASKTSSENWAQLLLVQEKHMGEQAAAQFISAFETGGFISSIVTGYITDWMVAKMSTSPCSPRLHVSIIYTFGAVCSMHQLVSSVHLINMWAFALGVCLYGNINIYGIVASEAAPPNMSGSSHAVVSLSANVGAIVAGLPLSMVANSYGWIGVFRLLEFALFLAVICKLINRNQPTEIGIKTD